MTLSHHKMTWKPVTLSNWLTSQSHHRAYIILCAPMYLTISFHFCFLTVLFPRQRWCYPHDLGNIWIYSLWCSSSHTIYPHGIGHRWFCRFCPVSTNELHKSSWSRGQHDIRMPVVCCVCLSESLVCLDGTRTLGPDCWETSPQNETSNVQKYHPSGDCLVWYSSKWRAGN